MLRMTGAMCMQQGKRNCSGVTVSALECGRWLVLAIGIEPIPLQSHPAMLIWQSLDVMIDEMRFHCRPEGRGWRCRCGLTGHSHSADKAKGGSW